MGFTVRSTAIISLAAASASAVVAQAAPAAQAPWAVPSDVLVEQRPVVFESHGAHLAGTLFLPAGTKPRAAVIALHGAQVPLRSDPLYRHLIQIMPRLGIAVLLYDRRGSGESTSGGAEAGNFDLLADDAVAARGRRSRAEAEAAETGISSEPWYKRTWLKGNIDDPE